ncbi:MAG: zf-TFIIB domain-containing protein [Candidatus Binatia bacterium]
MKTNTRQQKPSRLIAKEASSSLVSARSRQRTALSQKNRPTPQRKRTPKRTPLECPQCEITLHQRIFRDVPIDECPNCHGLWLDKGEFEQASRTGGEKWIGQFVIDLTKLMAHPAPFHAEA